MNRTALTLTFLTILFLTTGHIVYGQNKPLIYTNAANTYNKPAELKDLFPSNKVSEITLRPDSTFEFWSRPNVSCLTWSRHEGTWRRNKDSLIFFNNYEVEENDTRVTFKKESRQDFTITFKTDKDSELRNRDIKIKFVYDFDTQLEDPEKTVQLNAENALVIPFKEVPYLSDLAAIRIEYLLDFKEKRYCYLTQNETVNKKKADLPNNINVEFVETPKKEMVYRTIKMVIRKDNLIVVSSSKTKINLPDHHRDIEFETSYGLNK